VSTKLVAIALQLDADVCNALEPPRAGCHAGAGMHVVIPLDFAARIALGQEIPGCSYARLEVDGSLYVSDTAQAQLALPAVVNALPSAQKIEAPLLVIKLSTAVTVAAVVQSDGA